jgi:hypothetical protein
VQHADLDVRGKRRAPDSENRRDEKREHREREW